MADSSMMLTLRRYDGEAAWTDTCLTSGASLSGIVPDGDGNAQLSCYAFPNHSPDADTLLVLRLPGSKTPSLVASGVPALQLVSQVQDCFPTLVKVRPMASFESDTESDEDEDAVKERKRRKLLANPMTMAPLDDDVAIEAYCARWEASVRIVREDALQGELERMQVDAASVKHAFLTAVPGYYLLAELPPVLNASMKANVGFAVLHAVDPPGYLAIATPMHCQLPEDAAAMYVHSVYTFNGQRESTECGAGKTSSEMVDNIRRRHASGTFTKLVLPARTWDEIAATTSLALAKHFVGDLRLRKVMQTLPMGPVRIRLA